MQPQKHRAKDPVLGRTHPAAYYETMREQALQARAVKMNQVGLVDIFDPQGELAAGHDEQLVQELAQSLAQVSDVSIPLAGLLEGPLPGSNRAG